MDAVVKMPSRWQRATIASSADLDAGAKATMSIPFRSGWLAQTERSLRAMLKRPWGR